MTASQNYFKNADSGTPWDHRELWSMLGHDLRTPLNGIQGFLDLLATTRLDAAQREYLETALECTLSLRSILDGILECTQIESGRLYLCYQATDVRELIASVLVQNRRFVNGTEVELRAEIPSEFPRLVSVDQSKLRQILMNLVGNAVKFTKQGNVLVRVAEEHANEIILEVADTGVGIAPDQLNNVFEPYYQCARRDGRGLGLGLAIVKMLVTTLRGQAQVESVEGRGTVVTIRFPKNV